MNFLLFKIKCLFLHGPLQKQSEASQDRPTINGGMNKLRTLYTSVPE